MSEITFTLISHDSSEYKTAIELRRDVLRKPLGLTFSEEEIMKELYNHVHAGLLNDEVVVATLSKKMEIGRSTVYKLSKEMNLERK